MYMLGEVNLPTFLNSSQGKFMKQQMTDETILYILSCACHLLDRERSRDIQKVHIRFCVKQK